MKRLAQSEYEKLIEEYIALMKMHFGERLRSICLFGSVARGNAAANSDIDILVVADDLPEEIGLRIKETSYIHQKLKTGEGYSSLRTLGKSGLISDLYFTPNEIEKHPPILLDIAEDGIILYDEVGFLAKVLSVIRENLRKLGARKIITKKGYYWVLKPDIKPGEVVRI